MQINYLSPQANSSNVTNKNQKFILSAKNVQFIKTLYNCFALYVLQCKKVPKSVQILQWSPYDLTLSTSRTHQITYKQLKKQLMW